MVHTVSHSSDYCAARGLLRTGIKRIGASDLPDEFHVPSMGRLTGTYRCTILRQVGHERLHMSVLTGHVLELMARRPNIEAV